MKEGLFPWSDIVMNEICDTAIKALSVTEGEYIKKEDLFAKTINKNNIWLHITNAEGKNLKEIIEDLPTYSIPEREKGEWINTEEEGQYKCNNCGEICGFKKDKTYGYYVAEDLCPNCGADMRGGKE